MQHFAAESTGAAPIGSADFWKRPYRVPASSDPDTATAQTIGIMCGHVRHASKDEVVKHAAGAAFHQFAGLAGNVDDAQALASAAWWWCKTFVKFVHHEFIIRQLLGEAGHLQGLIAPEVLVRMDHPEGDCAIFSECVAAFLTVYGIPYEFVTVAVNPAEPDIFSHVYLYGVMPDGSRLALDASHGDYPGWQVPSTRVSRRQVWDSSGNRVPDRGSRFDGLHNYALRGMGTDGDTSGDYGGEFTIDVTGNPILTAGAGQSPAAITQNSTGPFIDYTTGTVYSGPAFTVPSQSNTAQWAAFSTAALKAGLTLAEINNIQPGTVVGANGQILRQNPGYAVGSPTGALNVGGVPMNTVLLIAAGFLLFTMVKK